MTLTHEQVVADLIKCFVETLPNDSDDLAHADFERFCAWAWSDDEPLRTYGIDRDTYQNCLEDAYASIAANRR